MMRIAAALAVVGLAVAGPVQAQTAAKPAAAKPAMAKPAPARTAAYRAARLPGTTHPDLNGVWQVMNQAGWDIEPHAARAALQLRPGPFVPVPAKDVLALGAVGAVPAGNGVVEGGEIPYKPEKKAQRDENRKNYTDLNKGDPEVKCYLPGVPRANYMHLPFQIFQSEKSMIMAYEYAGAVRNVMFNDPGPAPVDSWMGQSVAKWDGDTLVVTVTGLLDRTWFDRAGNYHSDQMTVVERYTPTGPLTLRYEATITDPETFTRPWKISMNLYKHVGEDARLNQFKCVEFVEELMYGKLRKEPLK
jgi:hypothetical protein